nr:uncharacterized protein [Tanacetum cinerariifolium]
IVECLSKADLVETKCRTEDPFRDKFVTSGIRARFEAMAIEIEKNAASESTVIDENRGRDDLRQNPKKRGTSKDIVANLDQRVTGVETSMSYLKTQVKGLEGLTPTSRRFVHGRDHEDTGGFGEEVSTLHQTIEDLQADVALCKRSLASGGDNTNHGVQDLSTAIAHTEALIDFSMRRESSNPKNQKVRALVDFCATHNFVADDKAKRIGINATKGSGTIKAVNSSAKAIHRVAKDVLAKIVTRLEMDEGSSKVKVPKVIERVLDKFKDVMPKELPKKLPLGGSHTLKEHVLHLKQVFQVLRDNELYVKLEKCSFAQNEVEFLGHKIKYGGLMMDGAKIKAIQDWEQPTKVTELRSFLGLVNYYGRFIMGYSTIASSLMDLLKKNKAWIRDEEYRAAFESLKKAVMEEPVLRLPDVTMPFELHTDASDFAIGGVLMQDGHRIAFESQKLNETKRKYTVQEKEMTTVVHCMRIWRHYLLGSRFVIKTDNITTSYFQTQKKLSPNQAYWQDFLAEFDYRLECKPRRLIKIIALAKDGRTRIFWLKGDMLFTKEDRLYVPKWGDLRQEILKECHDSKQDIAKEVGRIARAFTDAQRAMGECFYGLYHMIAKVKRTWKYYSGGGSILEVNALLEIYLRHYVSSNQHDWGKLLDVAQSSYNLQLSEATGKSPFELVTGRQPLTHNALAASCERSSLAAYKTMKEWHEQADLAWASLNKTAKKMKKWADEKRRYIRYEGPFSLIGRVGKESYRIQLPHKLKIYPVFHVSFHKPYHKEEEDPEREVSKRVPTTVVTSYDREVEEIISDCMIRRRGGTSYKKYLIKWHDLPDSEASWEAKDLLWQFTNEIKRYHEDGTTRTS